MYHKKYIDLNLKYYILGGRVPAVKRTIMQSPYDIGLQLPIVKLLYFMSFLNLHYMPSCLNK